MYRFFVHFFRFFLNATSFILAASLFVVIFLQYGDAPITYQLLVKWYGLTSLGYLYVTLLITPLTEIFPHFPFHTFLRIAKRPVGQAVFIFAFLHSVLAFFGTLGGAGNIILLPQNFLIALLAGFIALVLLFALTITSFDWAVRWLGGKGWKFIHRFVYLIGVLVVIHVALIGSHYTNLSGILAKISIVLLGYLLFMETLRIFHWLIHRAKPAPKPPAA